MPLLPESAYLLSMFRKVITSQKQFPFVNHAITLLAINRNFRSIHPQNQSCTNIAVLARASNSSRSEQNFEFSLFWWICVPDCFISLLFELVVSRKAMTIWCLKSKRIFEQLISHTAQMGFISSEPCSVLTRLFF